MPKALMQSKKKMVTRILIVKSGVPGEGCSVKWRKGDTMTDQYIIIELFNQKII